MSAEPISRSKTGEAARSTRDLPARPVRGATLIGCSSKEFHASHCGQRPSHRGDSKPQPEQK
jgi:hypothetical protein